MVRIEEKEPLPTFIAGRYKLLQTLKRTNWYCVSKLKMNIIFEIAIPLLRFYLTHTYIHTGKMTLLTEALCVIT